MSFWGVECDGKNEYKCILKKKKSMLKSQFYS